MPSYDSDSSSEEGGNFTTTNVTLGYATAESTGDDISHLGGYSTWLDAGTVPPAALAKCRVCNGYMSLLLQLNADLAHYFPNDERRLHVLCCRKKICSKKIGSIRAIREVQKAQGARPRERQRTNMSTAAEQKPAQDLGNTLFGGRTIPRDDGNVNPFSMSKPKEQPAPVNPFASLGSPSALAAIPPQQPVTDDEPPTQSFADKLKLGTALPRATSAQSASSQETWPPNTEFPPPFTNFNLDAYPEELEPEDATAEPAATTGPSKSQYDTDDANSTSLTALDKDTFESSLDKTFQKFSDRIAQNPEQVLRYEFKGQPLLYSGTDGVASRFVVPHGKPGAVRGIPRCEKCGSQRVFELQLVPGLIYELEKDDKDMDLDEGMEWGTIIVGTCGSNCGESGTISFSEEWVGVQWEERMIKK